MFDIRTDLAVEAHEIASKNKAPLPDGIIYSESKGKYKTTKIEIISKEGEKITGKPKGTYITLDIGKAWEGAIGETEDICRELSLIIKELSGDCTSVLAVGLGNNKVTADAIGPAAVEEIIVTRHLKKTHNKLFDDFFDISALAPGVLGQTGIESAEIIKSVIDRLSPSLVIAIDALASGNAGRLGSVIQISDAGIAPGSGVGNHRARLDRESLGVPVISIGVPTVVDALTLAANVMELANIAPEISRESKELEDCKNMFVTPKDCDKIIAFMSKAIGYAINMAFHRDLSFEEIVSLRS